MFTFLVRQYTRVRKARLGCWVNWLRKTRFQLGAYKRVGEITSSQMQFLPILGVTVNTGKDVYARTTF